MSMKGKLLFSIRDDPTPKVMRGGYCLHNRSKGLQRSIKCDGKDFRESSGRQQSKDMRGRNISDTQQPNGDRGGNVPMVMEDKQTTKEEYTQCWEEGVYREYDCNQCPYRLDCHKWEEDDPHAMVRRLTPLECERLQGYPDGWTDIGEWVDSKGKKHKDADSPRYKALGNSIALPFWEWMARRMVTYIGHKPTMASLFDGIGGFPLVFSRAGVDPIWASEIEEFPIAVTKIRFPDKETLHEKTTI